MKNHTVKFKNSKFQINYHRQLFEEHWSHLATSMEDWLSECQRIQSAKVEENVKKMIYAKKMMILQSVLLAKAISKLAGKRKLCLEKKMRSMRSSPEVPRDPNPNFWLSPWGQLVKRLASVTGGPSIGSREGKLFLTPGGTSDPREAQNFSHRPLTQSPTTFWLIYSI